MPYNKNIIKADLRGLFIEFSSIRQNRGGLVFDPYNTRAVIESIANHISNGHNMAQGRDQFLILIVNAKRTPTLAVADK